MEKVAPKNSFSDADFVHLRGVRKLDMGYCNQETITDAAFIHLAGIHMLDMSECDQDAITPVAITHLLGARVRASACSPAVQAAVHAF